MPGRFKRMLEDMGCSGLANHPLAKEEGAAYKDWIKRTKAKPIVNLETIQWSLKLKEKLGSIVDGGKGGLVRADLLDHFVSMLIQTPSEEELLRLMEGYVSPIHFQLLLVAIAAGNERDRGGDTAAKKLVASAERRYGPDAKKISNLYSAGYIESIFLFQRKWFQYEFQSNPKGKYRDWFEDQLKFFDRAVFVNLLAEPSDIEHELDKRLLSAKPQDFVSVWAAGKTNVERAHDGVEDWIEKHPSFDYQVLLQGYGSALGVTFRIFKRGLPGMRASRLKADWWKPA